MINEIKSSKHTNFKSKNYKLSVVRLKEKEVSESYAHGMGNDTTHVFSDHVTQIEDLIKFRTRDRAGGGSHQTSHLQITKFIYDFAFFEYT